MQRFAAKIAEQVWSCDIDMRQLQRLTATTWLVVGFPLVSFCVCDSLGADIQFPISVAANRDQVALAFLRYRSASGRKLRHHRQCLTG